MATFRYPKYVNAQSSSLGTDAMSRGQITDYLVIYVLNTSAGSGGFNPYANVGTASTSASWSKEGTNAGTIYLHMPNQIQSNYQVEYEDVSMGVLGASAVQALAGGGEVSAESIEAAAKSMKPEILAGTLSTALGMANNLTGVGGGISGSQLATLTQRKAFNPYKENVFKSVPFRNHSFNFKMVPRNKAEADEIKGIVNLLKWAMHPAYSSTGDAQGLAAQRWLDIPYSFGLEFKRLGGGNPQILYKFMPSVLTSLNVDYTPDGNYVTGRDLTDFNDHGLAVNLQMTFKETRMLTKEGMKQDNSSITY